jgi:F0F1-type ATP synthase assembly protein I
MDNDGGDRDEAGIPEVEHTEVPEPPDWEWKRPSAEEPRPKVGLPSSAYSRGMGLALAIGGVFVGPVLAGILLGVFLDRQFDSGWFTILGIFLGTTVALFLLIRLVNRLDKNG